MNKKIIFTIFLILIAIFVYPSYRLPGEDCIAGCLMPKGFPLPYSIIHGSGIAGGSSKEFIIINLIIDIIIWFIVANIICMIILYAKKLTNNVQPQK